MRNDHCAQQVGGGNERRKQSEGTSGIVFAVLIIPCYYGGREVCLYIPKEVKKMGDIGVP